MTIGLVLTGLTRMPTNMQWIKAVRDVFYGFLPAGEIFVRNPPQIHLHPLSLTKAQNYSIIEGINISHGTYLKYGRESLLLFPLIRFPPEFLQHKILSEIPNQTLHISLLPVPVAGDTCRCYWYLEGAFTRFHGPKSTAWISFPRTAVFIGSLTLRYAIEYNPMI